MKYHRLKPMIALLFAIAAGGAPRAGLASVDEATAPVGAGILERVVIMRVETRVVIEPSGALGDLRIETPLDPALQAALEKAIRGWRFKPVLIDGVPRRARASMHVVLAALGEGRNVRVDVDSVDFPMPSDPDAVVADGQLAPITAKRLGAPGYPPNQQQGGVMGTILLGIRVTPDGRAGEIASIQSMLLQNKHGESANRRSIREFEAVAIAAAKRWTFNVPASAVPRTAEQMTVAVPVQFNLGYDLDTPGRWLGVARLPKHQLPWLPPTPDSLKLGVASVTGSGISPMSSAFGLSSDVVGTSLQ